MPHRQHHSSKLHQSEKGHSLQATVPIGYINLDLVQRMEDISPGRTCIRSAQCASRRRVQDCEGSMRLNAQPVNFSSNNDNDRVTGGGPVYLAGDEAAPSLLQLEARSRSRGHGCLHAGLVSMQGFTNPPWCLIPCCLTKVKVQAAQLVLITPLWKTQSWHPTILELDSTTTGTGVNANGSEISDATRGTPVNRMACLRESYTSRGFSHQASDLMLASWSDKTNANYGSSFAKWAGWCQQWNRDLLSRPIEDIVNFLAGLFLEGYQYQSLNAYRSAISSTHDNVDGVNVGSHPGMTRLLKGAFHSRPPQPRYSSFWDVGLVIQYLRRLGPNRELSLKH